MANCVTDESGKYTLKSGPTEGARPGKYKVVISQLMKDGQPMVPGPDVSPMDLVVQGAVQTLHTNYSEYGTTILQAEVPAGGGTIDFNVDSLGTGQ